MLVALLALLFVSTAGAASAIAQEADSTAAKSDPYHGTSVPPDEALGFVPLPAGDVFSPLLADPKASSSHLAYVHGKSSSPFGTDLACVAVADRFGLLRWGGPHRGEGLQIGLQGGVFAQFDMDAPGFELLNADYEVGLPVTYRRGRASWRFRLYHQSSHLGDQFILGSGVPKHSYRFQSGEAILSRDSGPLRVYAGGEIRFNSTPRSVDTNVIHAGIELRQRDPAPRLGSLAGARLVGAVDVKAVEDLDWRVATSVRAGFELSRGDGDALRARCSLLGEYYNGPSPYGQFRDDVTWYGIGIHFSH